MSEDQQIDWMGVLKELVAATIGLAIVGSTLYMAFDVFGSASDADKNLKFDRTKEILALLLGLAGTVVGYYFGRIPGERLAKVSQQDAIKARGEADKIKSAAADLANNLGSDDKPDSEKVSDIGSELRKLAGS